jgi:hypothetical protein
MVKNTALISDEIKNYVPEIFRKMDFFNIPFDLKNLDIINNNIWCPTEDDKKYMTQNSYDEALLEYKNRKAKLLFTNVTVNYESCDCGGGYPCNHSQYPCEIIVKNGENSNLIKIDGNDSLEFYYNNTNINITGLKNFTYGDFIRFCKLCDITLESNYVL